MNSSDNGNISQKSDLMQESRMLSLHIYNVYVMCVCVWGVGINRIIINSRNLTSYDEFHLF